jgi:hypothetical protein
MADNEAIISIIIISKFYNDLNGKSQFHCMVQMLCKFSQGAIVSKLYSQAGVRSKIYVFV